jgi:hypothetical protein
MDDSLAIVETPKNVTGGGTSGGRGTGDGDGGVRGNNDGDENYVVAGVTDARVVVGGIGDGDDGVRGNGDALMVTVVLLYHILVFYIMLLLFYIMLLLTFM